MKLESIKTFVVGNPPPSFGGRYFVFVKIRTACGIEGVGEAYAATFSPHVIAAMAVDLFERVFAGEDPMQTETLWRRAYGEGFSLRPDISLMGVLSALEMACWDITGKALNRPIYSLLGGLVNPRLRSYTYLYPDENEDASFYGDPVRSAERAAVYVKQGFTAIKFDPVGGYSVFDPRQPTLERMDMSERFCKLIREAVGDKADILFGTHGQYTVSGAKRLARRLERTTLALARVAAGGARWWLTATRSGAERADGPAVLAAGAHRGTRCAPCGRYAQTASVRMLTKCAARTAPAAVLLGAPLKSPPPGTACRDALFVVGVASGSGLPLARACPARGRVGWLHRGGRNYSRMPQSHARQPRWSRQPHGAPQHHLRDWRPTRCGRPAR
jgi:hypothetical protein